MLLIKAEIKPSKIHGFGLFAIKFIPAGTRVWTFNKDVDIKLDETEFYDMIGSLSKDNENRVKSYAYCNKDDGYFILCGDNARFMNHSNYPNLKKDEDGDMIAIKDIYIGEEITENYEEYDLLFGQYKHELK